ncbi:tyrosinase cofactor [Streptomyces sp. NPDC020996]|uniref:tyrosinase cofactor n=1 Tax=Streptomyces sp. NPDC020996 TaxID=3154791 RepID=UPI0033E28F53
MVVGVGEVPAGNRPAAKEWARGGPDGGTRREVLRGLLAPAVVLALAPVVAASRPPHTRPGPEEPEATLFDETYRGRRIRGVRNPLGAAADGGRGDAAEWQVTVDGRPLHLMRRADGTWLSMVDHYRSYPTPLDAARGAVDELGPGERLRDLAPGPISEDHRHTGDAHGVPA